MMCLNKKELLKEKTEHTCFRVSNKSNSRSNKIATIAVGVFIAPFLPLALFSFDIIPIIVVGLLSCVWLGVFLDNIVFPKTHELYVDHRELVWRTRRKNKDVRNIAHFRLQYNGKAGLSEIDYIMAGGEGTAYLVYFKNGGSVHIPDCYRSDYESFFECLRRLAPHIELDPKVIREKWLRERKDKWKKVFGRK